MMPDELKKIREAVALCDRNPGEFWRLGVNQVRPLLAALDEATAKSDEARREIVRLREALQWALTECKGSTSDAQKWQEYAFLAFPPVG